MSAEGNASSPHRTATQPSFSGHLTDRGSPTNEFARRQTERVIAIRDIRSSKERLLESTSAAGKDAGARFPTLTYNNVVHHWYYEGWMWSPDGRSLLVLENHRTRPWVVDIKTDTVTELPWLADSMPSWQPVRRR